MSEEAAVIKATPAPAPAPVPAADAPGRIQRGRIGINVAVQIGLALVLFGMANYLGFKHYRQWDYTYSRDFSLAASTATFLEKLSRPLKVTVLTQGEGNVERDLAPLLEQYRRVTKNKVRVQFIDVLRDTAAWEQFKAHLYKTNLKIDGAGVLVESDGPAAPGEVKAASLKWIPEESLYELDAQKRPVLFKGESLLNAAIRSVTDPERPRAAYVTQITKVRALGTAGSSYEVFREIAGRQNIDLEPLTMLETPEEAFVYRALIIVNPMLFGEQQDAVLTKYLESPGRSVMILYDPEEECPQLDAFLQRYGIEPQNDRVLVAQSTATGPVVDFAVDVRFLEGSPVTAGLANEPSVLPGKTRSLKILTGLEKQRAENIHIVPLMRPAEAYWGDRKFTELLPVRGPEDNAPPLTVAVALERGAARDPRVQLQSSRLIVSGNSGLSLPVPHAPNFDFLTHSLNWMLHREVTAPNDSATDRVKHRFSINITAPQWQRLFLITTIVFPLAALTTGLVVWSLRRN